MLDDQGTASETIAAIEAAIDNSWLLRFRRPREAREDVRLIVLGFLQAWEPPIDLLADDWPRIRDRIVAELRQLGGRERPTGRVTVVGDTIVAISPHYKPVVVTADMAALAERVTPADAASPNDPGRASDQPSDRDKAARGS